MNATSRTVFIFGAGASHEAGAPLMNNFLQVAQDLRRSGRVQDVDSHFRLVDEARSLLAHSHSKSTGVDIDNLETVFSAFELARMVGTLGDMKKEDLKQLPHAYRIVIARTLEETLDFQNTQRGILAPEPYVRFANALVDLQSERKPIPTLISFNYDLGLDWALMKAGFNINYGFAQGRPIASVNLFKLHGSINWVYSERDKCPEHWDLRDANAHQQNFLYETSDIVRYRLSPNLNLFRQSENGEPTLPLIIPPTFNKGAENSYLNQVWSSAAEALKEAENIIVIGYSLPETDQFFKYLYSIGTIGRSIIRKFWVIDPSEISHERFQSLLGPAVKGKYLKTVKTFGQAMSTLPKEMTNF